MQTKLITLLLLFGAFTIQAQIKTPQPSPSSSVHQTIGLSEVSVDYSRPAMRGRVIFGDLVPYGKLWRTGANDATEIIIFSDVKFGDKVVKAGTYSLFTIPNEKEWTIIISSDTNTWATSGYKESNEVARITVPATKGDESIEAFAITFDEKGTMHMGWGNIRVAVPFTKLM